MSKVLEAPSVLSYGAPPTLTSNYKVSEFSLVVPKLESAIFELSEILKATLKNFQKVVTHRLEDAFKTTADFTEKKIAALKAKAAEVQSSNFWSTLQTIASFIWGALTFFTGLALYTHAAGAALTVAVSLVAVGIVSMTNLLIEHLGGWEWLLDKLGVEDLDKRAYLRLILPLLLTLLSLSVGWSVGPELWNQLNGAEKLKIFLSFLAQMGVVSTGFMESVSKGKVLFRQADVVALEKEMENQQQDVQALTKITVDLQKNTSQISKAFNALARKRNEMVELVTQKRN